MKIIITICVFLLVTSANAGLRVYDSSAGGDVDAVGASKSINNTSDSNKYDFNAREFAKELQGEKPKEVKPSKQGKTLSVSEIANELFDDLNAMDAEAGPPLGKVLIFVSIKKISAQLNSRLVKLAQKEGLALEAYVGGVDQNEYFKIIGGQYAESIQFPFEVDSDGNVAKEHKAEKYRTIIYNLPNGKQKRYNLGAYQQFAKDLKKVEKAVKK